MREIEKKTGHILPDSRARNPTNVTRGPWGNWVDIWCASCGTAYCGRVPEESVTFACWLCGPCSEKYGEDANFYLMPDEVFWERLAQAELEKYRHFLTDDDLAKIADDVNHPLSKLLREHRRGGR